MRRYDTLQITPCSQGSDVKLRLPAKGLIPVGRYGAEFAAFIRTNYDRIGQVIRDANIKAD